MSTRLQPALLEVARRYVTDEDVPGASMAVAHRGTITAVHIGTRDGAAGRVADGRTLYRIASISKTLTAWAVLGLRDAGRITLDDPVVHHLPELAAVRNPFGPTDAITVRMLLQHSSGLQGEPPVNRPGPWRPLPIDDVLARLDRTAVVVAPGSAFKYSNLGFDLLGTLIERVTGSPYGAHVRRAVLEPLGMVDTTLDPSDVTGPGRAVGFDPRDPAEPGLPHRPSKDHGPTAGQASGGWWSSIDDLATWLQAQIAPPEHDTGLTAASREELHRPAFRTDDRGGHYGLGWRVTRRGARTIIGHGGVTYGFEAIIGFEPDTAVAVVALANGIPSAGSMLHLRERLLDLVSERAEPDIAIRTREGAVTGTADRPGRAADGLRMTFREVGFRNDVAVDPGPILVEADGTRRRLRATDDPMRYVVMDGRAAGEQLQLLPDATGVVTALALGGYYFTRTRDDREAV